MSSRVVRSRILFSERFNVSIFSPISCFRLLKVSYISLYQDESIEDVTQIAVRRDRSYSKEDRLSMRRPSLSRIVRGVMSMRNYMIILIDL